MGVRNKRGADVGSDFMVACLRIKIKATKEKFKRQTKRFDVGKFTDGKVKKDFYTQLYNRF